MISFVCNVIKPLCRCVYLQDMLLRVHDLIFQFLHSHMLCTQLEKSSTRWQMKLKLQAKEFVYE